MGRFQAAQILPPALYREITEVRVSDPERSLRAARRRKRRAKLTPDGRLNIVAADHPARGVLAVGEDPIRMGNRHDYLARLLRVLSSDLIDGVMATMDVLEDLLVIHDRSLERGERGILDQKLLIASLNRGGVAGAIWEMDDPMTGPSPQTCVDWNLDGAKILLRLCPDDSGSLKTLVAAANAITSANALALPTFLEPLPVVKGADGFQVQQSKVPLVAAASIASALGDSSRNLWLKLPYCAEYEAVAAATTLPILILGGQPATEPTQLLTQVANAMAAGANVRGALVGRNLLYPEHADPLMLAEAVGAIVHKGCTVEQALAAARAGRAGGTAMSPVAEDR